MTMEFKLPELGENIETGDVVNVLVAAGDRVEQDQTVLELETDKATVEVPASVSGTITEVHVQAGDTVKVGQVIFTLEGTMVEAAEQTEPKAAPETEQAEPEPKEPEPKEETQPAATEKSTATAGQGAKRVIEFKLPELGENIDSGDVVRVLASAGDRVEENQSILELETDKATVEVPVTVGGTVKEIHIKEGDKAAVGQVILTLETVGQAETVAAEAVPTPKPEPAPAVEEPETRKAPARTLPIPEEWPVHYDVSPEVLPDPTRSVVPAAPNLRRLAREIGVDISQVQGTGPGGRITMADVKQEARQRLMGVKPVVTTGAAPAEPLPDFSKWNNCANGLLQRPSSLGASLRSRRFYSRW